MELFSSKSVAKKRGGMTCWSSSAIPVVGFIVAILVSIALSACSTLPPHSGAPSFETHLELQGQNVGLVPVRYPAEGNLVPLLNRAEAAGMGLVGGAGVGALLGLGAAAGVCTTLPLLCPVALYLVPAGAAAGAATGGVAGASLGTPQDEIDLREKEVAEGINLADIQHEFAPKIAAHYRGSDGQGFTLYPEVGPAEKDEKPDYKKGIPNAGHEFVLETAVQSVQYYEPESALPWADSEGYSVSVTVMIRLVRLVDGESLLSRRVGSAFHVDSLEIAPIVQGVEKALAELSAGVSAFVFSAVELPDVYTQQLHAADKAPGTSVAPFDEEAQDPVVSCCWICPVAPAMEVQPLWSKKERVKPFPVTESTNPELKWREFLDFEYAGMLEKRFAREVTDETYRLGVWAFDNGKRGPLVYEAAGLLEPFHRLENELAPGMEYLWGVKACVEFDQTEELCTPWSQFSNPRHSNCEAVMLREFYMYRFRTPAQRMSGPYGFSQKRH